MSPPRWRKEVERVLITEDRIARRIRVMAREIERDFSRTRRNGGWFHC